jgi:vacuolar protein 8
VLAKDGTDITELVALICDGNDAQKASAAAALWGLANCDDNQIPIAKAGGIPPLVALIRDGNAAQKASAAAALGNLAGCADNQIAIAQAKREAGI